VFGIQNFWWCYPAAEIATFVFVVMVSLHAKTITRLPRHDELMIFSRVVDHRTASDFPQFLRQAEQSIQKMELSKRQSYLLNLVIEEVCAAIIQNAFHEEIAKKQYIKITLIREENHDFSIFVRDNAKNYNPFDASKQNDPIHDLGITLIHKTADSIFYRRYQGFNSLVLKVAAETITGQQPADAQQGGELM
jgi:anti-sigma regulatory factor (Ser/Thr protein kinase)